jgi:hypothetical protein
MHAARLNISEAPLRNSFDSIAGAWLVPAVLQLFTLLFCGANFGLPAL